MTVLNVKADTASKSHWSLCKGLSLLSLLVGNLVILVGQARFEFNMLTNLEVDSFSWTHSVLWLVSSVVFAILSWSFATWTATWLDETFPNPDRLFRQLCSLHGLDQKDREMLNRIATQLTLKSPSLLFIDANNWSRLVPDASCTAEEAERLRKRIIG